MTSGTAETRLIVNGKSAGRSDLRSAITNLRSKDIALDVRSTFEAGDVQRLISEAIHEGVKRLIIGGGDGSVNEAFDALLNHNRSKRPELGILPLGSANDFATACKIPENLNAALSLACQGKTTAIGVPRTHGDEPPLPVHATQHQQCSPYTRG